MDGFGNCRDGVGGFGADVDLLNLNGRFERAGEIDVDNDAIVEIDAIVVYRVVDFVENADDEEILTIVVEGFGE